MPEAEDWMVFSSATLPFSRPGFSRAEILLPGAAEWHFAEWLQVRHGLSRHISCLPVQGGDHDTDLDKALENKEKQELLTP